MMRETTRKHVIKVSPLKISSSLFLVLFGVCSVSLDAHSYPVSKSPFSSYQTTSTQSVHLTRSARETPSPKIKSEPLASQGPFAPGTHNLSFGLGQVFLLGELGNTGATPPKRGYDNALGLQATYDYGVSELFAFESTFGYSSHSSGDLSMLYLSGGVRTNLIYFDQLVPFFNLGLGFYRPSQTLTNAATVSGLLFGLQMGAGVDLLISRSLFFGSRLTYHNMFTSSKRGSDGTNYEIGGAFTSFLIHVGFNF